MLANPYVLIAVGLAFAATSGAGYYFGWTHKGNSVAAQELREEKLLEKVALQTAEAISSIEIKNKTIHQKVEVQTREVPVYRDCQHTPAVLGLLNQALAGGGVGTGEGELPDANSPR